MRISVYTMTWDRLEYTRHCFASLEERAGHHYTHVVLDQGSTDGTVEWLKEWVKHGDRRVLYSPVNLGNAVGNNRAIEAVIAADRQLKPDLIVRMDNDCEVISGAILSNIAELYNCIGRYDKKYVISPHVEGIVNQPHRARYKWFGQFKLGIVAVIGGLFRVVPTDVLQRYRWPEAQNQIHGEESSFCQWFKDHGGEVAYAEDLIVSHFRGTDQQALDYPEYHARKMILAK